MEKSTARTPKTPTESDMIYAKTYVCPVCEQEFKVKTVKQSKARLLGTDIDLRPKYRTIDPIKYGAILCKSCGYAALTNYFDGLSDSQIDLITENISKKYVPNPRPEEDIYSYDEALEIHKLAYISAVVKRAKTSEKAFICLKAAWILRGKVEELTDKGASEEEIAKAKTEENNYLIEAYKGFIMAMETESTTTICGMEPAKLTYLCAALAYETGEYEESQKLVSRIFVMPDATKSIKDKCTDLKDLLNEKLKKNKKD